MTNETSRRTGELEYDPATGRYHLYHDWESDEPLSYTVMQATLAVTGDGPCTGQPLMESVNLDALDELFVYTEKPGGSLDRLTFSHQGCLVTVQRNGRVSAYPSDDGERERDRILNGP